MIVIGRDDPVAISSAIPTASAYPSADGTNDSPLSSSTTLWVKVYAFGGLGIVLTVILSALAYWSWKYFIKGVVPPWLKPQHESIKVVRIDEKTTPDLESDGADADSMADGKQREDDEFHIPPVRYHRNTITRNRSSSMPALPMYRADVERRGAPRDRNVSLATTPSTSKGKRVSWASTTSTLGSKDDSEHQPPSRRASTRPSSIYYRAPSYVDTPRTVPVARRSIPRSSTSRPASRRESQTMSHTRQGEFAFHGAPVRGCTCADIGPHDISNRGYCEVQGHQD
ncbi:hypothetical protein GALMADRAFT_808623 [Galerina marginata CBS 339.88]|uniref:Uncharacterized protein n=1 Tax=Galerina marginata (strain CBS 339.88) TaxID=685588 RepID=A0A067SWL3_GALM3|nr:hypothetical protein GALMADRAFT_808623 [Galerina marginata CBS 339.88]